MAAPGTTDVSLDTRPIAALINRTRFLLRSSWGATGFGLTAGVALTALVVSVLADLAVPMAVAFRCLAFLLVVVPTVWVFLVGVVIPLARRLRPVDVARRIESHIPGMHNRLVSCMDHETRDAMRKQSPAFYRRLVGEALDRIARFAPSTVVDFPSLKKALGFAAAATVAFALLAAIFSERLPTTLARIFLPLADIPPATGTEFTLSPGTAKALRGDEVPFAVAVTKGEPLEMSIELYPRTGGASVRHRFEPIKGEAGKWAFTLASGSLGAGFDAGFDYRVFGGRTWSKKHTITLLERPVVKDVSTILHYPTYMGIGEPRVGPPNVPDVTGPEASHVEVVVAAEGSVAAGDIQILEWKTIRTPVGRRTETVWFENTPPDGAQVVGTWQFDDKTHNKPTHTEPAAVGTHGHWFQNAKEALKLPEGQVIFTYVYLSPTARPETVMLQFQDEAGSWEHRAFWGADKVQMGAPNTPSRHFMGELPPAGVWVRLEVSPRLVGLEGKAIRGMAFTLSGGQAFWHRAGIVPPMFLEETTLDVVKSFPLAASGEAGRWTGRFPLTGEGLYRVEVRNELGHANKPMKEAKYVSIPDQPPQIVLEKPTGDMVLSQPQKVPLVAQAYDDFGLGEVYLAVQKSGSLSFERSLLKRYGEVKRSDTLVSALDLGAMGLKLGDMIRYRLEVIDRKPGREPVMTKELTIRLADDPSAADKQLEAFEKSQDPFREKLAKLISEQAQVKEEIEKLADKYKPLTEKIEEAKVKAEEAVRAALETKDPKAVEAAKNQPLKLDPELEKELTALRKELQHLSQKEAKNAGLAQEIAADLARVAQEATKQQLLPGEIAAEMKALQNQFDNAALRPLKNLADQMARDANPQAKAKDTPDTRGMNEQANKLQQALEGMRQKMDALADAQQGLKSDADKALAKLRDDLLKQKGQMTAQELEELKDFIAKLRDDLKRLEGDQDKLKRDTRDAADADLPKVEKEQDKFDPKAAEKLAAAKDLLEGEKTAKRMKRKRDPLFPDEPYSPDGAEKMATPREADTDEPLPKKDDPVAKNEPRPSDPKKAEEDDDDKKFMPALAGQKLKEDPRFAKKQRPREKQKKDGEMTAADKQRENLLDRQDNQLDKLEAAQKSLAADQKSLDEMLAALEKAAKGKQGQQPSGDEPMGDENESSEQSLAEMMQSEAMKAALAMAARMKGLKEGKGQGKDGQNQPRSAQQPMGSPNPNLNGNLPPGGSITEEELAKLDLPTRTVMLSLQPKLREEILQGMRDQGPEGYRRFIQDYFKRLTEVKK